MRLLMIFTFLLLTPTAFADVIVVDPNGLTRAAKRGVDSAKITVEFTSESPKSLKLKSADGSNQDLSVGISSGKAVLKQVPAGTWVVQASNSNYKVQIK